MEEANRQYSEEEIQEMAKRLAAYEETGMDPERIIRMLQNFYEFVEIYQQIDWKRLTELHEADDDGRIIVMEPGTDIGEVSDGYHTFNALYEQRIVLFAALVSAFPGRSWKSRRHADGEIPFGGGWFIVGIDTPDGQYTYHYPDKHWELFHCRELETAPEWDGHTDKDVWRLLSLNAEAANEV